MYKTIGGDYTVSRTKLHDCLIDKIQKGNTSNSPIAVLMGGGSGAGKGTIRRNIIVPNFKKLGVSFTICDSDDIKKIIPEYDTYIKQGVENSAYLVHEESTDIVDKLIKHSINNKENILFDGTMKNFVKYKNLIDKLHRNGYIVYLYGVIIPLEMAISRCQNRAVKTGRTVPNDVILESHNGFTRCFRSISKMCDYCYLYDNTNHTKLIYECGNIINISLYSKFLNL